jgi:hypothetical protein
MLSSVCELLQVKTRISDLENGQIVVEKDVPRRCRSCLEPDGICDGRCWGFWKDYVSKPSQQSTNYENHKGRRAKTEHYDFREN